MKKIIKSGVVALSSILLLSGCQIVSKHVDTIVNFIEEEKPNEAVDSFHTSMKNEGISEDAKNKIKAEIIPYLLSDIEQLTEEYINKEVDYGLVSSFLEDYKKMDISEVNDLIEEKEEETSTVKESRDKLQKGLQALEDQEYVKGIQLLVQVDQDTEEYEVAQEKTKIARKIYFDETMTKSEELFKNGEYEEAYKVLTKLSISFSNFTIEKMLVEYEEKFIDFKIDEADALIEENKFSEAFAILDYVGGIVGENELIALKRKDYGVLHKQFKDELLTVFMEKTNQYYDDFEEVTFVAPLDHSAQYVDIFANETSFYPRLIMGDDYSVLQMVAGFGDQKWLYLEAIDLKVDGELLTWSFDYYDVMDDLDEYGVYEWLILDESTQPMLLEDLEKIANSENTTLRFQGKGYIEHIVTKEEKEQIRLFLDLQEAMGTKIISGPTV